MRPRLLDFYVTAELFPVFGISVAVFLLIFLSNRILELTNFIVNKGVDAGSVALMLAYSTPGFLVYVVPISVMIAVLLVFMRMAGDNEVVALKAAGVSLARLLLPVLFFSLCCCLFTLFMTMWGSPRGKAGFKQIVYGVIAGNPDLGINEREFVNSFRKMTIYVGHIDKASRTLTNVFIQDERTAGKPLTICAPSGKVSFNLHDRIFTISLYNGTIHQADLENRTSQTMRFETYTINLDIRKMVTGARKSAELRDDDEMTLAELLSHIKGIRDKGEGYVSAVMKLHKRFSIPLACMVLGVLAVPIGVRARGRRSSSGIGIALFFFLVYYLLLSLGQVLGSKGVIPPQAGMWLPDLVLGFFGIFLLMQENGYGIFTRIKGRLS